MAFRQYTLLTCGTAILCCLSFETWLLPKGRHKEGEGDRMDNYFYMEPSPKVWRQKMAPKQSSSQQTFVDVTRLIATNDQSKIYIILKNKPLKNWLHKPRVLTIRIGFYCDIEPSSNTVVPWLVRTNLSTVLYETDVCMKLFNMASPKCSKRGGTNREVRLHFT
jgi:hypothetical protein